MGGGVEQHQQWMAGFDRGGFRCKRQLLPAPQGFENMLDSFHQYGAIANQLMATASARMMN
ncbi:hypothetical protein D3C85_1755050 [compost metagenome]